MAKKFELHERGTNEVVYPITKPECVLVDEDSTLKDWMDEKDVTPYPEPNEIVYTTVSGNAIEWDETPSNVVSNIYYKEKGFGKIVITNNNPPSFENNTDLKTAILGNNLLTFLSESFQGCTNLRTIELSKNTTSLNLSLFRECHSLERIVIPDKVRTIKQNCFYNCYNLKEVYLPDGLNNLETSSFYGCKSLNYINLPDSINAIGANAFSGCSSLSSITLPSKITNINNNLFSYCTSLNHIDFNKIETIGNRAFDQCPSLTSIDTKEVKSLGTYAFNGCHNLKHIVLPKVNSVGITPFYYVKPSFFDTSLTTIDSINSPSINYLEVLILRSTTLVEDVEEYVTTFTLEEGQPLPEGAKIIPKPESEIATISDVEGGIMPLTNLDTYIGTPNNWLKIYVPNNLLKRYQDRYPILKGHFHPITGEDIYATKDEVEKKVDIIPTSEETLNAEIGKYYRFDEEVNSLNVTLPNITDDSNIKSIILSFTTGDAPAITISSNKDISYFEGYIVQANTTYELNIMFNGIKWIVAYGTIE